MKPVLRLISALTLAWTVFCSTTVWAEETELATEVAVRTGKITRTTLHRYVMAYGMIEPAPEMNGIPPASSKIAAPLTGILTQLHCEEGRRVKKGDLLFELDTRSADALIAKAEVAVEFAQKNFARKQQLLSTDNVSRKFYDEAEQLLQTARADLQSAKTQRELLRIRAPLTGTVAAIHFKVGEAVSQNSVLADLIDLERLNLAMRIPSGEAEALRLEQLVDISAGATQVWSGIDAPPIQRGKLIFIGPQIDPLTDTVLVRASLNTDAGLRPGQFVSARIDVDEFPGRLTVPVESIVTGDGASVIAVVEGDRAEQKIVKTGLRDGNLIEVSGEGLREGMIIVTQGAYGLPPKTRIRVEK